MKAVLPLLLLMLATPGYARDLRNICEREDRGQIYSCLMAEHQSLDARMSQIYNQLIPQLNPEDVAPLRRAQRAWIAFRDLDCEAAKFRDRGGREELIYQAECLILRTKTRSEELTHWLKAPR